MLVMPLERDDVDRLFRVWGWVYLAVGLACVIAGVLLYAANQRPSVAATAGLTLSPLGLLLLVDRFTRFRALRARWLERPEAVRETG